MAAWSTGSESGLRFTTAVIAPAMAPTPTATPTKRPHQVLSQAQRGAEGAAEAGCPAGDDADWCFEDGNRSTGPAARPGDAPPVRRLPLFETFPPDRRDRAVNSLPHI